MGFKPPSRNKTQCSGVLRLSFQFPGSAKCVIKQPFVLEDITLNIHGRREPKLYIIVAFNNEEVENGGR